METKVIAAGAIGAGVGVLQTVALREFVDKKYPLTNVASLKGWGTPSALAGMIGGVLGLGVGAYGAGKGKDGRQRLADVYVEPAIDYGAAAFVGGLLSGWKPAVTEADCVAAGGFCRMLNVQDFLKLINMRSRYTTNTFQTELTTETSKRSKRKRSRISICFVEGGLAKTTVLPENEKDCMDQEAGCFLMLSGF